MNNMRKSMRKNTIKKLVLGVCICSLFTGLTGCASSQQDAPMSAVNKQEEVTKADYNEDEASNLGHWGRAMGSVLIYLNDGDPYYFGGYQITENNTSAAVRILSTSWNINSREDLLIQIQSLLLTGDRADYLKEAKEMNAMSKKDLKTAMKQLSGELLIHYQMVQYNWKTWKKKGLLAWDMCRISHLVQWGYVAGYLNREEAQALIEPAAKKLQETFTTWDEVQNNWLDGYCLFASVDREAANTDYTNRKALYETLREEQPEDAPLYDDSLFTKELLPISGISSETLFAELETDSKTKQKDTEKNTDTVKQTGNSDNNSTQTLENTDHQKDSE